MCWTVFCVAQVNSVYFGLTCQWSVVRTHFLIPSLGLQATQASVREGQTDFNKKNIVFEWCEHVYFAVLDCPALKGIILLYV